MAFLRSRGFFAVILPALFVALSGCGPSKNFGTRVQGSEAGQTQPIEAPDPSVLSNWRNIEGARFLCHRLDTRAWWVFLVDDDQVVSALEAKPREDRLSSVRFDQFERVKDWVRPSRREVGEVSELRESADVWLLTTDIKPETRRRNVSLSARAHLTRKQVMDGKRTRTFYWDLVLRSFRDGTAGLWLQAYSFDSIGIFGYDLVSQELFSFSECERN